MREGHEAGREKILDMEKGGLRSLKEIVVNEAKQNMERAYDGSGWLTVLTRSQYRTDLSREEFRDALR